MTVAVPIIRLICDIVTFFFVQIPIRKAMREYSLSHILAMALADLMAIVWIPEILEFANIGSDTATVLSVFMLALIAYSLLRYDEPAHAIPKCVEMHSECERRAAVAESSAGRDRRKTHQSWPHPHALFHQQCKQS